MTKMISLNEFKAAQNLISTYVKSSPLIKSTWLSKELKADIYLKLECLQPGHSFKIRGATNALLSQPKLPKRVLTASGGNHGLGVAIACNRLNVPCTIVLPISTPSHRIQLLNEIGASTLIYGEAWDEANSRALTMADDPGTLYIHAFADREVILGQGTISLELFSALDSIDILMASVGGGGLLSGISLALEALGKKNDVKIFSVETKGAESLAKSLQLQKLVELPAITSIAKSLGAKKLSEFNFETLNRLIDKYFVVTDKSAVECLLQFLDQEKLLVEPAASCLIAAAFENRDLFKNKKAVFIICGSNVTINEIEHWKQQFNLFY